MKSRSVSRDRVFVVLLCVMALTVVDAAFCSASLPVGRPDNVGNRVLQRGADDALGTISTREPEPDPVHCHVAPCDALHGLVLAPDGPSPIAATICTITIHNSSDNPLNNVSCLMLSMPGSSPRWCTTAVNQANTDARGLCFITLRGGGCYTASEAARVYANGIVIRSYDNVKSPDFDGSGPDGAVSLPDLLAFRGPVGCHDYDNNGSMDLSDLLIFSSAYVPPHTCTLVTVP
jgi:hypothetical protein